MFRNRLLSNTQFYLLYVLTAALSLIVTIWVKLAVWPSVEDNTVAREFYYSIQQDDFWVEDDGSMPIFAASHLVKIFNESKGGPNGGNSG